MKPIKPEEIEKVLAKREFPDFVIEAFNTLILKESSGGAKRVAIKQADVIDLILTLANGEIKRQDIFDNDWLDVEPLYRENGWFVDYCKPPYYDSSPSYFTFERK